MQESSEVSMKIPFFERRRRIRRPWTLLFFGIAFLLLPFLNYLGITSQLQISPQMPVVALKLLNPVELILLFTPILVGIGLLAVKRWGWWLFLAYAVVLIVHNIYALARSPGYYNAGALIQTILGVAAVLYFVRRDISAPYMRMYPRGWRIQKRKPVEFDLMVHRTPRSTRDVSDSGLYVAWEDCYREPGEEVHLAFFLDGAEYKCRAGVVRVDEDGAGIAYRGVTRAFKKNIMRDIAKLENLNQP